MESERACKIPDDHAGHICELENSQEWDILAKVTSNPSMKCENCGAVANSGRNLCMPTELS